MQDNDYHRFDSYNFLFAESSEEFYAHDITSLTIEDILNRDFEGGIVGVDV